jgi:hypothetical protein
MRTTTTTAAMTRTRFTARVLSLATANRRADRAGLPRGECGHEAGDTLRGHVTGLADDDLDDRTFPGTVRIENRSYFIL